jgi:hypothetical protein
VVVLATEGVVDFGALFLVDFAVQFPDFEVWAEEF